MPLNMRTHGHGQGYMDMNFIIPEMIKRMDYQKGVYYPQNGDFSSAGAAHIYLPNALESGSATVEVGEYGYKRALLMDDFKTASGNLVLGLEGQTYDGPWSDVEEGVEKKNFWPVTMVIRHREPTLSPLWLTTISGTPLTRSHKEPSIRESLILTVLWIPASAGSPAVTVCRAVVG